MFRAPRMQRWIFFLTNNRTNRSNTKIIFQRCHFFSSAPEIEKIFLENNYNHIKSLRTQELRILSENCCSKKIEDVIMWSEISKNAIEKCNDFKFFDALLLLSSFEKMDIVDTTLYKVFSDVFIKQINRFEPRHFLLLIQLYYKANIFPRVLFIQVFQCIIKYANKLYPEEYVNFFTCFADLKIVNKELIKTLCKSVVKNINLFNYLHLSSIVSSLRSLEVSDDVFYYVVDEKQSKELKFLTVQELFDYVKQIKLLAYSWDLYESDLIKEFLFRIKEMKNEKDVDQLEDPFVCLNYLVTKNYLTNDFLLALSKWCANKVYSYPSRSAKRPVSYQLIKLYELMKERKVSNFDFIEKAIHRFVITRGGLENNRDKMVRPVDYQKGRKYIFTKDPLLDLNRGSNQTSQTEPDEEKGALEISSYCDIPSSLEKNTPISEKQKYVSLSFEKTTENKKETFSNSRYCNFKLRQRPKRIKNKPVPADV